MFRIRSLCLFFLVGILFFTISCFDHSDKEAISTSEYKLEIPVGFPTPIIPEDNPLNIHKILLGEKLFFDPILSLDSNISCAFCHQPQFAFSDNMPISPGSRGRFGFRNAPTLANAIYLKAVHRDLGIPKLDLQAVAPIEDENEMNLPVLKAVKRLNRQKPYRALFMKAFGEEATPFTLTRALGAFQRTLISGNSRYDQYVFQHKKEVLSASELRGMDLFFSDKTKCSQCHEGFNFTNQKVENNGLYLHFEDSGRRRATLKEEDNGKFKVPTLRNIALTAPYMHDGSVETLEEVIAHYDSGGQNHPNKSPLVQPLQLSLTEKTDLINFLHCLTDSSFILKHIKQ